MKFAVVVQGRFHAFDLSRALIRRGHDVTVFTNYPKWATARFGLPAERVRSFWAHGVATRVGYMLHDRGLAPEPSPHLLPVFGRWAATQLQREKWDVIHGWSGTCEEIMQAPQLRTTLRLVMRGSAHIRTQLRLLEEEEQRAGVPMDKPHPWMVAREEREYRLTDQIVTLSTFARNSFLEEGVSTDRVSAVPLGADLKAFRQPDAVLEERCRRILAGEPLRVLFVGNLSFQKGLLDLAKIVRGLSPHRFHVTIVGHGLRETASLVRDLAQCCSVVARQPQAQLPARYAAADLFVFPTIQDGFAAVLAQAAASGLPILATTNCGAPDIVREAETGWILPIRNAHAFVERLQWCDDNRVELVSIVRRCHAHYQSRTWDDTATDFEALCYGLKAERRTGASA